LKCGCDCGLCQSNRRRRGNYKGHRWYVRPKSAVIPWGHLTMIRKPGTSDSSGLGTGPEPDGWALAYPTLFEWLTLRVYSDGTARETSTLTFSVDGDWIKLCINDRAAKRKCWLSGRTMEQLLEDAEKGLEGDNMEWRADHWVGGGRGKK